VLVTIAILAWAYSAPPCALHSRGLGELTTAIVVTGLTPWVGYRLQGGETPRLLFVALLPLMLLQFNMLLTIEFPDADGDRRTGKKTLVVRFGPAIAALTSQGALISVYAWLPLLMRLGLPSRVALSVALGLPLAAWQWWRLSRRAWATPAEWEALAFRSVALLVGTASIELVAFLIVRAGVAPN
jgi:1,4-dihydroxy-2-naphthoate octaprenyltransferase